MVKLFVQCSDSAVDSESETRSGVSVVLTSELETGYNFVAQLRNSLPSMVVEILEEKLDREYCDNAAKLMLKTVGKGLLGAFSDDDCEDHDGDQTSAAQLPNKDDNLLELPKTWEPMGEKEVQITVVLVEALF